MKLATFSTDLYRGVGLIKGDLLIPLSDAAPGMPAEMKNLVEKWDELADTVRRLGEEAANAIPLGQVKLDAPVPRPSKVLAIGLNYADHVAESGLETPKHQLWFSKLVNSVSGPSDDIEIPVTSSQIDYEVELVAVIGRQGRHISVEDAHRYVFGYCVGNDVSARDWQMRTPQWILGKSFDTHGPYGPYITTAEDLGDPHSLGIRSYVNGELRQNSNTKHLIFNVWDQIAHLSQVMTLEPGDLIFTGTPGGVGVARTPPVFLKPGDVVRCEIDHLGAIENCCVDEKSTRAA